MSYVAAPLRHFSLLAVLSLLFAVGCSRAGSPGDGDGDGDGGDDGDNTVVEQCETTIEPVASGVCEARGGSGPAVLLRGDVLGPESVFADGEVLYSGDEILCAGCDCSSNPAYASATRVDCPGAVISPGLINPHDHLSFTEGAPIPTGLNRYNHRHDWRGTLSTPGNPNGSGADSAGMRWGEVRMMLSGVTSLVGSGRANDLVRNLDQLAPAERDRGFATAEFETFSLGDSGEQFRADCDWNYRFTELEVAEQAAFLPHVAEGIDDYAAEEFRCQSTSFDGGQDFTEPNASHIHSIGLQATDYLKMAGDGTRLIWSPRSNISLYGHTAKVTLFDRLGGTVALGTDWTYSGSANMLRELACADQLNRDHYDDHFTDKQLWEMATINAAIATGNEVMIGSLEAGKIADVAVFADPNGVRYHRAVLEAGNAEVALVVQSGAPMLGETTTLGALGASCDPIDVCGHARSICVSREVGVTFDALAAEVSGSYQAVFCGAPPNEPTCTPLRPGEYTGALTADDPDGDGLAGAADNCPNVFNPVRPIDSGIQPDLDGDGIGDECDPDPLLADLDGDGVANDADNCPFVANADQSDGDGDMRGDACDFCPGTPNPTSVCLGEPPELSSVVAIRTGAVGLGTDVSLEGLVVTAVWNAGVYAQDPAGGAENSGLHLFVGANPGVAVGDTINASGTVSEFFDELQLENASVTKTGTGAINPTQLTVAEAMDEKYEGMLVSLTDIATVDDPHDCSGDNVDCSDDLLWEVNDSIVVFDRAYQDADWAAMSGSTSVTGVMSYRFERRRILPRTTSDLQ